MFKNFIKKHKKIIQFIVVGGGLYLLWTLFYNIYVKEQTDWDYYLNDNISNLTIFLLELFGYDSMKEIDSDHVIVSLVNSNHRGVWVGDNCNGFKLFSIFSIFMLAFPANWKSKVWFIPLGIIIVHLANVIRIAALVLINDANPALLDFNHDYTFTIFVYAIIFGLWFWWLKKYSQKLS
ncbi:MAG: exosortase X [Putridiphycobacter sp.]